MFVFVFIRVFRIIPARAGFTALIIGSDGHDRDHPRSRGVYPLRRRVLAFRRGSSPLARGLLSVGGSVCADGRIIPARAGFTLRTKMREIMP